MSYGLRNTLILLFVLLLFVGGGWAYLNFVQESRIEELEVEVSARQTELTQKQLIASQYETLLQQYESALFYIDNYDKALFTSSNEDVVFDFLNNVNTGISFTDFTFSFDDSTDAEEYGILNIDISGAGFYRYVNNFIRKIELSRPINKISEVTLSPINTLEEYGRVNFSFRLQSFYDKSNIIENPSLSISETVALNAVNNPFYPLIRDITPNENNMVNVESSTLIALSTERAFLIDQDQILQRVDIGDVVYLGSLQSINLQERTATFVLNKGGLIERVTLEVQQ